MAGGGGAAAENSIVRHGIAKIPRDSEPDEAGSFGLVCIGGKSYLAPKAEFLKLCAKPNEKMRSQSRDLVELSTTNCGDEEQVCSQSAAEDPERR